jgi:hypothetical protein
MPAAHFPAARIGVGMYESFYLRAVSPEEPVGVWIRNTVHKAPGRPPRGSVWCTLFDARRDGPFMHKMTSAEVVAPSDGWIAIGDRMPADAGRLPAVQGAEMSPRHAAGRCGEASWSISFTTREQGLRHLSPQLLYRTALPRTKLTSPIPSATFAGVFALQGQQPLVLDGWSGMVGHNWGTEHAARWIWLHGVAFDGEPDAWLDIALGRVRVAGHLTPWLASGAVSLHGQRHRLGGLWARGTRVHESPRGCELTLGGEGGVGVQLQARVPDGSAAGWLYADPGGGDHDVINCSIAELAVTARTPDGRAHELHSDHGGAYELGLQDRGHGVPVAPFGDGNL